MTDNLAIELLREQNQLLRDLLDEVRGGLTMKREYSKNRYVEPMSQDEYDSLDDDIDLDWWFSVYGEEYRPAKYMDRQKLGYSKREVDYMHKRLCEIASTFPKNEAGTHEFRFVGKKYCKADKNTFNCFAFVPVNK